MERINYLKNTNSTRYYKYLRNARLYTYSPLLSLEDLDEFQTIGYYSINTFSDESTSSVQENVVASCIDTLVSKIASTKVRPFFNTVNGTFKDIKVIKQVQQFFDLYFEKENINSVITNAFRDACIFDTGVIYIDPLNYKIKSVYPWQVYIDQAAASYGEFNDILYEQKKYEYKGKKTIRQIYINLKEKKLYELYPELNIEKKYDYTAEKLPFLFMHYSSPVVGTACQSICDLLYGIQMQIDAILGKVKDSTLLNPATMHFVPEGSTIKAQTLSNQVGQIITYRPVPGQTGVPVLTSQPAVIDPSFLKLLEQLKQDAYEMVGISALSATSQKPTGLNSGAALNTMEDIESDRFETQLNQVIRTYTDLTRLFIEIVPEDANILPKQRTRSPVTWSDVKNEEKVMNVQFSGADLLSKDPSIKLAQLTQMKNEGIIPASRIPMLLQVPDLEQGYSLANNAIEAVLTTIDNAIGYEEYDVPFYIPIDMLKEEIANTLLSLTNGNEENKESIKRLTKLYESVMEKQKAVEETIDMQAKNEAMDNLTEQQNIANGAQQAQQQGFLEGQQKAMVELNGPEQSDSVDSNYDNNAENILGEIANG